jgi:hypothetical protein
MTPKQIGKQKCVVLHAKFKRTTNTELDTIYIVANQCAFVSLNSDVVEN